MSRRKSSGCKITTITCMSLSARRSMKGSRGRLKKSWDKRNILRKRRLVMGMREEVAIKNRKLVRISQTFLMKIRYQEIRILEQTQKTCVWLLPTTNMNKDRSKGKDTFWKKNKEKKFRRQCLKDFELMTCQANMSRILKWVQLDSYIKKITACTYKTVDRMAPMTKTTHFHLHCYFFPTWTLFVFVFF